MGQDFRLGIHYTFEQGQGFLSKVIGEPGQSLGYPLEHFYGRRERPARIRQANGIAVVHLDSYSVHRVQTNLSLGFDLNQPFGIG